MFTVCEGFVVKNLCEGFCVLEPNIFIISLEIFLEIRTFYPTLFNLLFSCLNKQPKTCVTVAYNQLLLILIIPLLYVCRFCYHSIIIIIALFVSTFLPPPPISHGSEHKPPYFNFQQHTILNMSN